MSVPGVASAADPLLSQGKTTTASSVENAGTPAVNATDGNTGTRFWLLTKEPNGTWKRMISEIGIAEFVPSNKGRAGWPSLSIGGPGFCFPVYRWNGRVWELYTFEYEGKRCKKP